MLRYPLFFLFLFSLVVKAQDTSYVQVYHKYWVQFTDKNYNAFSVERPYEFLSQRAIDRRVRQNISIDITDVPVTQVYVDSVLNTGVKLLIKSKWLNGIVIETTDSVALAKISTLDFASKIKPIAAYFQMLIDTTDTTGIESYPMLESPVLTENYLYDEELYGSAYNQINMLHGQYLHELGFRGESKVIAVLDAGFNSVQQLGVFDSLWQTNRILGYRDFVEGNDDSVFYESTHGMAVLSTMGGNTPGKIVGTAPDASFWLIRTEDAGSEYLIEEYNWAAGAEFADSVGADIINSSLGYTTFNDTLMNYSYSDMDGNTAISTIAADMAAQKGMIVVNSAGNQGNSKWRYISAPADGNQVLAIGALTPESQYATFSSQGPSFDGRIKPDIVSQGKDVAVINTNNDVVASNGTSFASPIMAGMMASLWDAFPDRSAADITSHVIESASQFSDPNDTLGYGIPDFRLAFLRLQEEKGSPYQRQRLPLAYPNPFDDQLHVMIFTKESGEYFVELIDALGRRIIHEEDNIGELRYHEFILTGLDLLQTGVYLIRAGKKDDSEIVRIVKF